LTYHFHVFRDIKGCSDDAFFTNVAAKALAGIFYPFSQNFFLTFAEKSDVLIGVLQHNQTVKKSKKKETGYRPPLECLFYLHNIRYQPKGEKNH